MDRCLHKADFKSSWALGKSSPDERYWPRENSLPVQWIRIRRFHCQGPSLIPGQGSKIPQAPWRGPKKKKKKKGTDPAIPF